MQNPKLIFLSGGGTLGSVTPLLAMAQVLRQQDSDIRFLWVGTKGGPERRLVEQEGMPFQTIASGKWRRYFNWRNIIDPFFIVLGFFQSLLLIIVRRPAVIVSAGGFVSVPLVWAGWLLRVPCVIHQQDITVGLANKLMQPFAKKITVAFQEQLKLFPAHKTVWTGNPVREGILQGDRAAAMKLFYLEEGIPTLFITGGGTGAEFLNDLVVDALPELIKFCQIIHLTGEKLSHPRATPTIVGGEPGIQAHSGLDSRFRGNDIENKKRYHPFPFLTAEMPYAFAVANLVICRAGMGTLTELTALGKPAIVIPMPHSHQEENAAFFAAHKAVEVVNQENLTSEELVKHIKNLLVDTVRQQTLSQHIQSLMPANAAVRMAEVVIKMVRG